MLPQQVGQPAATMVAKDLSLHHYIKTEAYPGSETKGLARSHVSHPLSWTLSLC